MPKSDTWPGGVCGGGGGGVGEGSVTLDTMAVMDTAGSWDSVVSVNSGFSDDSMDYLSAEERACLMFLEETIDSLDTEEDSGLSNDEPDQPLPGNLDAKMVKLSASMGNSRINGSQKHDSKRPFTNILEGRKPAHSYLVPTPLLVANSTNHALPEGAGTPGRKRSSHSRSQINAPNIQPVPPPWCPPRPVPSEAQTTPSPPPVKPKTYLGRTGEAPPARGPLSYDALVHLRRSASAKKTPLCPTVDHTKGGPQRSPISMATAHPDPRNLARAPSSASAQGAPDRPRTSPPTVAPKPSKATPLASRTASIGAASPSDEPSPGKRFADPQKIRKEALQKLGLLQEEREPASSTTSLLDSEPQPARDLVSKTVVRAPASAPKNPSGSPSLPQCLGPKEPPGRPVQSSASFHHYTPRRGQNFLSDPCDTDAQHPRMGGENPGPSLTRSVSMGVPSGSCDAQGRQRHKVVHMKVSEPVRGARSATPAGFSVAVFPGMGPHRKEALRKLGLLKD